MGKDMEVTTALETALDGATTADEIREIILDEAAKQNIVIPRDSRGRFVPETKAEDANKETKQEEVSDGEDKTIIYEDDFVIGGKKYHFESDSPTGINQQVKAAMAAHENAVNPEKPASEEKQGLTADERISLQLDMQMGVITPEEYLEKTGFMDSYLEKKGIKVDQLKDIVQEKITKKETNAWENATNAFLKDSDWPGGDQNLKVMGYKLAELGLSDKPSPESLKKAYESMKAEGLVFQPVKEQTTQEPAKKKATGSSIFGLSGGNISNKGAKQAAVPQVTDNMSPMEIMALYKATALENGQNPDDLLKENYSGRGR